MTPPAYAAVTATFIPGDGSYSVNGDPGDNDIDILCNTGATNPVSTPNAPCVDVTTMDVNPGDGTDTVDLSLVSAATFPNLTGAFINAGTEIFSPAGHPHRLAAAGLDLRRLPGPGQGWRRKRLL